METSPEGFVTQEQHDAAMLALRAEFGEAANERQMEINSLKADRDHWQAAASAAITDNSGLKNALANYLQNTGTGTVIIAEFRRWLLESQVKIIQDQLGRLS